jgi:hypothetical protein
LASDISVIAADIYTDRPEINGEISLIAADIYTDRPEINGEHTPHLFSLAFN